MPDDPLKNDVLARAGDDASRASRPGLWSSPQWNFVASTPLLDLDGKPRTR
jgi:hypothetical protein